MSTTLAYQVRVRASSPDPFAGLRGHDYIKARGLSPLVRLNGVAGPDKECTCEPCVQARLLPAVQRICQMEH